MFWVGRTASAVGDWLLQIALPLYVYSRTGSTLSTAVAFMSATLPGLLFGPVTGALVDRWDRRRIMLAADIARSAVLLVLLAEPSRQLIWIVYLAAAAQACLTQLFVPARSAAVPTLVASEQLVAANTALGAGSEVALLAGPVLGGVIYAFAGLRLGAGVDIASYLASAATIAAIRSPTFRHPIAPQRSAGTSETHPPSHAVCASLIAGWRYTAAHRALRSLLTVSAVSFLAGGLLTVLIVSFARTHLHATGTEYGTILSAQAVGGLLGALTARRTLGPTTSARRTMTASY